MRDLSKFERQLAEMTKMDRVLQASATMVKSIESAAAIGRQLHEAARIAVMEKVIQSSAVAQSMVWAKNAARAEEILRSAAANQQSVARASMIFHAGDRIGVKLAMDGFLRGDRSLRAAMMEIEKRKILIEEVAKQTRADRWIAHELRAMRNVAVHEQELTVEDDVDQPLLKPLIVDVKKNLDAIDRSNADQQDFMEHYRPGAEAEHLNVATRPAHPPGMRMMGIAEAVFSVQDVELVFEPLVVDYRMEMNEALCAGDIANQYALRAEYRTRFVYAIVQVAWSVFTRVFHAIRRS